MYFIFVYLVKGEIENWKNAYLINLFLHARPWYLKPSFTLIDRGLLVFVKQKIIPFLQKLFDAH